MFPLDTELGGKQAAHTVRLKVTVDCGHCCMKAPFRGGGCNDAVSLSVETYIGAVVEEVGGEGVAKDPTSAVIIWKQFCLFLLLLVFALNLQQTEKHTP